MMAINQFAENNHRALNDIQKKGDSLMTENTHNEDEQKEVGYPVKTVRIVAEMSDDDQTNDDIQENEFLTPSIESHYRNDLE